jgi:multiple sugar transport system permease protein
MPALVAVHVWKVFPFVAIMVLAGLQAIPTSLYEAAQVDGATFWDEVRHIMLPALSSTITAITLLLLVNGFNSITIVYAMTRGGPANRSLLTSIQIFKEAFEYSRFNQASALSIMFFIVVSTVIAIYVCWTAKQARADA